MEVSATLTTDKFLALSLESFLLNAIKKIIINCTNCNIAGLAIAQYQVCTKLNI